MEADKRSVRVPLHPLPECCRTSRTYGRPLGGWTVWGDAKLDNVVFHPSKPEVAALLDWELCAIGSSARLFPLNTRRTLNFRGWLFQGVL